MIRERMEGKRHPETLYKPGEYVLKRTSLRGQGYWGQVCSDWTRIPVGTPEAAYLVATDEHSEKMAEVVIELEARLEWKNSTTIKRVYSAFDQQDWEKLRAYQLHLRAKDDLSSTAIESIVDGLNHLGLGVEDITAEKLNAVYEMVVVVRSHTYTNLPDYTYFGKLAAVVLSNPDDLQAILAILRQRPETAFDAIAVRDLIPVFEGVPVTLHEGVL